MRRFGDSKDKGGGSLPIWIKYEHFGLEFGFQSKDWADSQNPIVYVKVFKRTKDQTECSMCLKSIKMMD